MAEAPIIELPKPTSFLGAAIAEPPKPTEIENTPQLTPIDPATGESAEAPVVNREAERAKVDMKATPKAKGKAGAAIVDPEAEETRVEAPEKPKVEDPKAVAGETGVETTPGNEDELDDKKLGKLTPKEIRAAFKARNTAERELKMAKLQVDKLAQENKQITRLTAQIAELEKRPTTEANDAKIAAAEAELSKRKGDMDAELKKVKDREDNVQLREYATDVTKTDAYKGYVLDPRDSLLKRLELTCRGAVGTDEEAKELQNTIINALAFDDPAVRWRAFKAAIADLNPADQTALASAHEKWAQIMANHDNLTADSKRAREVLESSRKLAETQKTEAFKGGYSKALEETGREIDNIVTVFRADRSKLPKEYVELIENCEQQIKNFDPHNVTPETLATMVNMALKFQAGALISKDFTKRQEAKLEDTQKQLATQKEEFDTVKAELDALKAKISEEEADAEAVNPSLEDGRSGTVVPRTSNTPGLVTVGGGFASSVMNG